MRRLLLLAAMSLATTMSFVAPAAATPPQDVTITIAEVFHATGPCTGDITASGGVFGQSITGSMECQSFSPVGAPWQLPPTAKPPHLFEYTAVDRYTFAGGSFLITFQATCTIVAADPFPGPQTIACDGNWRVNGGTGDYVGLIGTGKFTELQEIDDPVVFSGTGTVTEVGKMHID
jgi:hypothetical protein